MENLKNLTIKELIFQLEYEILEEHDLFLAGYFDEANEHKNLSYKIKQEIINRCFEEIN